MMELLWAGAIVGAVAVGLFFTLVSTAGVIRLPDVYARAHTASQADTLGAGFALAGVALYLGWQPVSVKTVVLLFFIFVTNPTAAHAIARAAHEEGIVPWTVDDDREDTDLAEAGRASGSRGPDDPDDPDDRSAPGVADGGRVVEGGNVVGAGAERAGVERASAERGGDDRADPGGEDA